MLQAPAKTKATFDEQPALILRYPARLDQILKAAFDYVLVVPAFVLLLPLFAIISLAIKLESPGPIFYRRQVLGAHGRFFGAYRFRTMYIDGQERLASNRRQWVALLRQEPHVVDPRYTKVGRFLRRYAIDDLPRLLNIMNREMSLVGPHLLNQRDVMRLGQQRVRAITTVRPGLTGLWQLRQGNSLIERSNLEIDYINNWSLRRDVQILLCTFKIIREGQIL
jgi:lipopolysaccharide/colanic/teichoic acid biosynthesis glycosyltransferase